MMSQCDYAALKLFIYLADHAPVNVIMIFAKTDL